MKQFNKLALAAAVCAALPVSGFAMEAMEDAALSDVTGQDGITLGLATDLTATLKIHDADGLTGSNLTGDSGAMIISGFSITRAATTDSISIAIDTDGNGGTPTLNIGVSLPNNLSINLGAVTIADSSRTVASALTTGWTTANTTATILNLGNMTLGATTLNMQLGTEAQGNMIALNTTITNGIQLTGFSLNDIDSTGSISADIWVTNNADTSGLTVNTGINATGSGLSMTLDGIGNATGMDVRLANVNVGGAGNIGDIELIGLNLTGNLVISGH